MAKTSYNMPTNHAGVAASSWRDLLVCGASRVNLSSRRLLHILIGLTIGFSFSLLCMPFYDCNSLGSGRRYELASSIGGGGGNDSATKLLRLKQQDFYQRSQLEQQELNLLEQQHQQQIDEFEPRINLEGKPKSPSKPVKKIIRTRYASTELNIRDKLFVGVLSTSRQLGELTSVHNETISGHADKLTFFVNNAEMSEKLLLDITPSGISVVNFNDNRDHLLPFHAFKYSAKYLNEYDWFFFVTDHTFVRANKLVDFLNHVSISQDIYIGHSIFNDNNGSAICNISTGIIFSNTVMRKLKDNFDWCAKNALLNDMSESIGNCALHSTGLGCSFSANGHFANFFLGDQMDIINDLVFLRNLPSFNQSITVSSLYNEDAFRRIRIYFNQVELDDIEDEIGKLERNIVDTVCNTPEGCNSLTWPLGVPQPHKPTSRHEVIRWDYFNETHLYLPNDFEVISELSEYYKLDIEEVLTFSMSQLNRDESRYELFKLLNGYKQFDPTRGSSYILDLILVDALNKSRVKIHKRVNVMRPLGHVEIMPMPYVTENARITIVVTFSFENSFNDVIDFFQNYEEFVLSKNDVAQNIDLFIVHLKTQSGREDSATSKDENEINENRNYEFKENRIEMQVKNVVESLKEKYSSLFKKSTQIAQTQLLIVNRTLALSESYRQLQVAELVSEKLSSDSLVFLAQPCSEMKQEFFNRIRLNTIKEKQVYFPVPFSEFIPNIIYKQEPIPLEVEINKHKGYFNTDSYEFASFYVSDYLVTRDKFVSENKLLSRRNKAADLTRIRIDLADHLDDLYELFSSNRNLHVIRASDQAFKCRWRLKSDCNKRRTKREQTSCLNQRYKGLGTKSQLAFYLMSHLAENANNSNT